MGARRGYEARRRGAEHELEHLAALPAHDQSPSLFVHGEHDPTLEAAAKVGDACVRPDARDGS